MHSSVPGAGRTGSAAGPSMRSLRSSTDKSQLRTGSTPSATEYAFYTASSQGLRAVCLFHQGGGWAAAGVPTGAEVGCGLNRHTSCQVQEAAGPRSCQDRSNKHVHVHSSHTSRSNPHSSDLGCRCCPVLPAHALAVSPTPAPAHAAQQTQIEPLPW